MKYLVTCLQHFIATRRIFPAVFPSMKYSSFTAFNNFTDTMSIENEAADMPQELAKKLFAEGAFLIIVGIPSGIEFGIDLSTYKVGEMFRGIKMIPSGPHFIYTAAGDSALRVGFLNYFHPNEIIIREWDVEKEELTNYTKNDLHEQIARIQENIRELDRFLGPYDYQNLEKWQNLTNDITEEIIANVAPLNNMIRTSAEFQSCTDEERPRGSSQTNTANLSLYAKRTEDELLPNLKTVPETVLRFSRIPSICAKNASPAEISHAHIDCIQSIEKYFAGFRSTMDAIKEIQLSFVLYLSGYSLDALAHWRNLLRFFSNSEASVVKYKAFYMRYLEVLQRQLPELPVELMTASENNTVYKDVGNLILNCYLGGLKIETNTIRSELAEKMSWNFEGIFEEDPDDMPVIVEL